MDNNQCTNTPFGQVPIEITICVGRAHPSIQELLNLKPETILPLDTRVNDPVELYVRDTLIAKGELEEIDTPNGPGLAVRLTEIFGLNSSQHEIQVAE